MAICAAVAGAAANGRGVVRQARRGGGRAGETAYPAQAYSKTRDKWQFVLTIPGVFMVEQVSDGKTAWARTADATEAMRPAQFEQEGPATRLGGMNVKSKEAFGGRDVWVGERAGVPAHFDAGTADRKLEQVFRAAEVSLNAEVEDSRFETEVNTLAYRAALRKSTEESLNRYLKGIEAGAARAGLENMRNFAPEDGRILYDPIVAQGYKRGIEIGAARGNSAIWMGLAFQKNGGRPITVERDAELAKVAGENFKRAGLAEVVECRNNDAFKEIPLLEGSFDFVFMDTGTALHKKFMDLLYDRVAAGGAITSDPNLDTKITRTLSGGVSVSIKRK